MPSSSPRVYSTEFNQIFSLALGRSDILNCMQVSFQKLHQDAIVPSYQSEEAAGVDLHACIDVPMTIEPGKAIIVPTGLAIALPKGYEGQVRSRSGMAAKFSVAVLNSPGTIDSDYRGEVGVILINHGHEAYAVSHGDRVAQLVVAKHDQVQFIEVNELNTTARGDGGFGGTGK